MIIIIIITIYNYRVQCYNGFLLFTNVMFVCV